MTKDNEVRTDEFAAIPILLPVSGKSDRMYF